MGKGIEDEERSIGKRDIEKEKRIDERKRRVGKEREIGKVREQKEEYSI